MSASVDDSTSGTVRTLALDAVQRLPKIELHAHLSGSITQDKLRELTIARGRPPFEKFDCREVRADADAEDPHAAVMAKCFTYFDAVAQVVTDLASLREAALHIFGEFAKDNCLYLELRTNTKEFSGTSKEDYVATVRDAALEFNRGRSEAGDDTMVIRLLLSLDRGRIKSGEDATRIIEENLELAAKFHDFVVGFDVCGNPASPSVVPFLIPALLERREAFNDGHGKGWPITWHLGEKVDDEEVGRVLEVLDVLNIRRLGHVCFVSDEDRKRLLARESSCIGSTFGVELCPTSNLVTMQLASLSDHHFREWYRQSEGVGVSICTDDLGMFGGTLSSEVHAIADAFQLDLEELQQLELSALETSFLDAETKAAVRERIFAA